MPELGPPELGPPELGLPGLTLTIFRRINAPLARGRTTILDWLVDPCHMAAA